MLLESQRGRVDRDLSKPRWNDPARSPSGLEHPPDSGRRQRGRIEAEGSGPGRAVGYWVVAVPRPGGAGLLSVRPGWVGRGPGGVVRYTSSYVENRASGDLVRGTWERVRGP